MNPTKQYCVKTRSILGRTYYYYATSELHAKYCYWAAHPESIGLDNIEDIYELPQHPSFQFKE